MISDFSGAFAWQSKPLPPLPDDLYQDYEDRQRVRMDACGYEQKRERTGKRDFLGVVAALLAILFIGFAMLVGAKGGL